MLLNRIRSLLRTSSGNFQFLFMYREANVCAHLLAAHGCTQVENLIVYNTMPVGLLMALSTNMRGL